MARKYPFLLDYAVIQQNILGNCLVRYTILDTYSADAAYSTRQLKSSGGVTNCVRLRRSSDNAESDFGFVNKKLDTASIATWLGANTAYLVTWYDQSGNTRDATQPTAGNQPIYRTTGGKPWFELSDTRTLTISHTASAVRRWDSLPGIGAWGLSGLTLSGSYTLQRSANQVILAASPTAGAQAAFHNVCQTQAQSVANTAITSLAGFFYNTALATINYPLNWNTSQITNMSTMFQLATVFNQPLSSFNTANVTNMQQMFNGAAAFNQLLSGFNTAKVTNISFMLNACTAFNRDVSGWNVAAVTTAQNFLSGSAFSQTNYDLLLVAWAAQNVKTGVLFHAGSAKYGAGAPATARGTLTTTKTWTITDGGPA